MIECGAQATGGNYSFVREDVDNPIRPGFPIAELSDERRMVVILRDLDTTNGTTVTPPQGTTTSGSPSRPRRRETR